MASESIEDPFEMSSGSPAEMSGGSQHSWDQLRQAVHKTRKLAQSIVTRMPHTFTFRHLQTKDGVKTRLYFLGVPQGSRENTLLFINLPNLSELSADIVLSPSEWLPLLDTFQATPPHGKFSKEEQLLRERKRLGAFGITSYDFSFGRGRFAFPASNSLFYCEDKLVDNDISNAPLTVLEAKSARTGARLDPKICPTNSSLVAWIHCSDIWVTNLATGHEARLTFAHKGCSDISDDPLSAGLPSFVVQEEFDRYTGYWWQPENYNRDSRYRILYEEVDESDVDILHIVSPDEEGVDKYRYPKAGTTNARCCLKLLEFSVDSSGAICDIEEKHLKDDLSDLFPGTEYLTRAGWTPNGKYVYVQLLDRKQQKQQLVLISSQSFTSKLNNGVVEMRDITSIVNTLSSSVQVVYDATSDVWIDVSDVLHFFPQSNESEISFLLTSEKSGFSHLYFVTASLQSVINSNNAFDMLDAHHAYKRANVRETVVTRGEWEVDSRQIWVDAKKELVYFMGLKETPLESHLYVTSYSNPGVITRLTTPSASHTVQLDEDCSMFVTVDSSIDTAPSSKVYRILHKPDGSIATTLIAVMNKPNSNCEDYRTPQLFNYLSMSGTRMYGMYYKPCNHQEGQKHPTVLFVYGGPQVQLVTNSYKGIRSMRLQTLASLGYAVVTIDSRGSHHRGLMFESHIRHKMGQVEIADQVEGLQWLAGQVDFIDLNRVAIHGWSYGGYLSLMGLAQRPDVFKLAIAGAPVTSWHLYDTGYTERYLDTPAANPDAYKQGSVLDYVSQFPSESNRLLIVHGLIDENVHFTHTKILINALIKACKQYQLQVYPNERHGIRNPESSEHYETMVLEFLQRNL